MVSVIMGEWIVFRARGHHNVRATHRSTLEITRESHLTPRGDCIIAVESEVSLADLPGSMKEAIRAGSIVVLVICVEGICDSIVGRGHPDLLLSDETRIIVRKSDYVDEKTLMIKSNKSARDLRRDLVRLLRQGAAATVAIGVLPVRLLL